MRSDMGPLAYIIYAFVLFTGYITYIMGYAFFIEYAFPWLVFIAALFAPLVWISIRKSKVK
jgi:hypothetical protein